MVIIMSRYTADKRKVIETSKMDNIIDLGYDGQYGYVSAGLYRSKKSHNWYDVEESCWSGNGNIYYVSLMDMESAAALVMDHCPERISEFPELAEFVAGVIDE
jgi:hypothetical protein